MVRKMMAFSWIDWILRKIAYLISEGNFSVDELTLFFTIYDSVNVFITIHIKLVLTERE